MQHLLGTHFGLVKQITQVETTLILIELLFEGQEIFIRLYEVC